MNKSFSDLFLLKSNTKCTYNWKLAQMMLLAQFVSRNLVWKLCARTLVICFVGAGAFAIGSITLSRRLCHAGVCVVVVLGVASKSMRSKAIDSKNNLGVVHIMGHQWWARRSCPRRDRRARHRCWVCFFDRHINIYTSSISLLSIIYHLIHFYIHIIIYTWTESECAR